MARVLITDGEERSALAAVRSLGRAGHDVFVCSGRRRSLAGSSRYARGHFTLASPLADSSSFVKELAALASELHIDVLIPVSEASLRSVLPERIRFEHCRIPFASAEQFAAISDKALLAQRARDLGVATPRQVTLRSPSDLQAAAEIMRFPAVLKPSNSVVSENGRQFKPPVSYITDGNHLQEVVRRMPAVAYPLLLQQRIEGAGVGVFLLRWDEEILASFFHKRIREKPPAGGVSVVRESVAPDERLFERSAALLTAFDWRGVAMIEYKLDASSGQAYLLEVNGRFWGSLQLAIDVGIDFPGLLLDAVLGRNPAPCHRYRVGVRSRWWWGDVDHLLARLRRSRQQLSLPPSAPSRAHAILNFLAAGGTSRGEVLRADDPLPAIRETLDWLRGR